MNQLAENLIQQGWLRTPRIIDSFLKIERADFLPNDKKYLADYNEAVPIGCGQTISQPLVVAFMLELLQPAPGEKILDIGFGSGWTTALLADIVGSEGAVIAIERISALADFGEKNVTQYGFPKKGTVKFIARDGFYGYPEYTSSPDFVDGFDKILCSAALPDKTVVPSSWREQLKVEGVIVTPLGSSIWFLKKKESMNFEAKEFPGFSFVPFVQDSGIADFDHYGPEELDGNF